MTAIDAENPPKNALTSLRILVVDDYIDSANGLAKWLRYLGNDVAVAFDGLEGIQAAGTFRPDIVLLDIGMPKLNGYEVAERIRQEPWGKRMMLVAVTGYKEEQERKRVRKLFDAYLVKPLIYKQVIGLLASYSRSSRAFVPQPFASRIPIRDFDR